jgi:hypothetical protein
MSAGASCRSSTLCPAQCILDGAYQLQGSLAHYHHRALRSQVFLTPCCPSTLPAPAGMHQAAMSSSGRYVSCPRLCLSKL